MSTNPPFENLVEDYQEEIFGYLWRIFRERSDAEDCLQETFLRAYKAYRRFQGPGNPRAWLYRIATNTAFSRLKRDRTARQKLGLIAAEQDQTHPSPADLAEVRGLVREVLQSVEALPDRQKAALILRIYQGMSYAEIAVALNSSPVAARANVYQALRKLRTQFHALESREVVQ